MRRPIAPRWVRRYAPFLGRFWGVGVTRYHRLGVNEPIFDWARRDPESLRAAARTLAEGGKPDAPAQRLRNEFERDAGRAAVLMRARPQALVEAVEILIRRGDAVRRALLRYPYTDPDDIGGYLDQDLAPAGDGGGV